MGLICLLNEVVEGFNRAGFSSLGFGHLLLQSGLLDDQGVLQILELRKLKPAFCKGGVEPVNFGFEGGKLGIVVGNVTLTRLRFVVLPKGRTRQWSALIP